MPTKENKAGEQQNYNPSNGEFESSNDSSEKIKSLKSQIRKLGVKLEDLGYSSSSGNISKESILREATRKLKESGMREEDIDELKKYAKEQQNKKNESFNNFLKESEEKYIKKIFGDDAKEKNGRISWKRKINDNEINIVSKNIQFWANKNTYVMWVDNDKVIYLKPWQVQPIKNWSLQENAYAVKLNRQYFKPYQSYKTDAYSFNKPDTFDDLVKVAEEQDKANKEWKLGHYAGI